MFSLVPHFLDQDRMATDEGALRVGSARAYRPSRVEPKDGRCLLVSRCTAQNCELIGGQLCVG